MTKEMIKIKLELDLNNSWSKNENIEWFEVYNELIYPHTLQWRLDEVLNSGLLQFNSTNLKSHIKPFTLAKVTDDEGIVIYWFATSESVMAVRPQPFYKHNVALIELSKVFEKFLINTKAFTQPRGLENRDNTFVFNELTAEILRKYKINIDFNDSEINSLDHRELTFGSGFSLFDVLYQIGKTQNALQKAIFDENTNSLNVDWFSLDTPEEIIEINEDNIVTFNQEQDIDYFCSSFESEQVNVVGENIITVTNLQPISEDVRVAHDNAFIRLPSAVNRVTGISVDRVTSVNPQGGAVYLRMPSIGRLSSWSSVNTNQWRNILPHSNARNIIQNYHAGNPATTSHGPWSDIAPQLRAIGVLDDHFQFVTNMSIAERRLPNYQDPITGKISSMDFFVIWHTSANNTIIGSHGTEGQGSMPLTSRLFSFEEYSLLGEREKSGSIFWKQGSTDIRGFGHFFGTPWFRPNDRSLIDIINSTSGAISIAGSNGLNVLSTIGSSTATGGGMGTMPLRNTLDEFVSSLRFEPIPSQVTSQNVTWRNWMFVSSHSTQNQFINSQFTIEYEPISDTMLKKTKEEPEYLDFTKSYSNRTLLTDAKKLVTDMELTLKRTGNPLITLEYRGNIGEVGKKVKVYDEEYLIKAKTLRFYPDTKKTTLELTKEFDLSKLIGVPSQHRELYIPDADIVPRYIHHNFDVDINEFNALKDEFHQFVFYAHGRNHYMVLNFVKHIQENTIIFTYKMADNFSVIKSSTASSSTERMRVDNTYVDENGEVDYRNGSGNIVNYAIINNKDMINNTDQQQPLLHNQFANRDLFNTPYIFSGINPNIPNRFMEGQGPLHKIEGIATDLQNAPIIKDSREKLVFVFQFNLKKE